MNWSHFECSWNFSHSRCSWSQRCLGGRQWYGSGDWPFDHLNRLQARHPSGRGSALQGLSCKACRLFRAIGQESNKRHRHSVVRHTTCLRSLVKQNLRTASIRSNGDSASLILVENEDQVKKTTMLHTQHCKIIWTIEVVPIFQIRNWLKKRRWQGQPPARITLVHIPWMLTEI